MNQTIFIRRNSRGTLYRDTGDGLEYVEGSYLLTDFYVGNYIRVGSRFTRTFGTDWWQTSNIKLIKSIIPKENGVQIHFQTCNTPYVLVVSKESIEYREDLEPLVAETRRDINSDKWLEIAKEFYERMNDEYKESQSKAIEPADFPSTPGSTPDGET